MSQQQRNERPKNNVITIRGRLAFDPDMKENVGTFKVPVGSYRKKRNAAPDEKYLYETNWFRVVCFRDMMETARAFVKGDSVIVTGSLEISEWMKDGVKNVTVEIHATEIVRDEEGYSASTGAASTGGGRTPEQRQPTSRAPQQPRQSLGSWLDQGGEPEFSDDDTPF